MKNTIAPTKRKQPSKSSRWAYFMQAIEPKSEAINKAFPGYHPQWLQQSQMMTIAAENFAMLRLMLGMTVEQCAAYLRTKPRNVDDWECGKKPIPFAEFELMRMILESVPFRLSHPEWDGWFLSKSGRLVSPQIGGEGFVPSDLNLLTRTIGENSRLATEVRKLQADLDKAIAENTNLRQMYLEQGVVDELFDMQDKINGLMSRIATARIIPFAAQAADSRLEKTA